MANTHSETTRATQDRIYRCLKRFEDGLKSSEISEQLNIERRTVDNHLHTMRARGDVQKDGTVWYVEKNRHELLRKLDLHPEEAFVLYLASRLLVKQHDKRNPIAEDMLLKLADMLYSDAGISAYIVKAAEELKQRQQTQDEHIFRTVVRAYLYRQPLKISYEKADGTEFTTEIEPYLLEPSAINYAIYIIAKDHTQNAIRTYRLQRIRSAEPVRGEDFIIPPDFDGLELLRSAWSIYYGEETLQVTLRFHPSVSRRVQETYWHPSQQDIEMDPEGYAILRFEVADTTDLKPWIRSWGHNCEVLEPETLRAEMIGEARQLAERYGWKVHRFAPEDEEDKLNLDVTLNDYFGNE